MDTIIIKYLDKNNNFKPAEIEFTGNDMFVRAVYWGRENISNFSIDMINYK